MPFGGMIKKMALFVTPIRPFFKGDRDEPSQKEDGVVDALSAVEQLFLLLWKPGAKAIFPSHVLFPIAVEARSGDWHAFDSRNHRFARLLYSGEGIKVPDSIEKATLSISFPWRGMVRVARI